MYWNYRLLRAERDGEVTTAVVEVYYNDDDTLQGYTDPITVEVFGDGDVRSMLQQMLAAVDKPVLTPADFTPPK